MRQRSFAKNVKFQFEGIKSFDKDKNLPVCVESSESVTFRVQIFIYITKTKLSHRPRSSKRQFSVDLVSQQMFYKWLPSFQWSGEMGGGFGRWLIGFAFLVWFFCFTFVCSIFISEIRYRSSVQQSRTTTTTDDTQRTNSDIPVDDCNKKWGGIKIQWDLTETLLFTLCPSEIYAKNDWSRRWIWGSANSTVGTNVAFVEVYRRLQFTICLTDLIDGVNRISIRHLYLDPSPTVHYIVWTINPFLHFTTC